MQFNDQVENKREEERQHLYKIELFNGRGLDKPLMLAVYPKKVSK